MWRCHGGPETAENRVLLHPTCHSKVHRSPLREYHTLVLWIRKIGVLYDAKSPEAD
ncbi:MAG: hypothetical protein M3380_16685 [Chloroflexota bacterium]|nr:hypothetical protein [Chloroflexota bacterium]